MAELKGIELKDSKYTIKQNLILNRYEIYDSKGNLVMRSKQKWFKIKEEFPFLDANDKPVFTVKAKNILDIIGDYGIIDEKTGKTIAVLNKKFTFFKHIWRVRNKEGKEIAMIESEGAFVEFLRSLSSLFSFLPRKYTITSGNKEIGIIKKELGIRDVYHINIKTKQSREALIAACIAIDAVEEN